MYLKEEADIFVHPTDSLLTYDDTKLFKWRNGSAVDLLLSLKQIYTDKAVDQLSISQRKCIFPDKYDDSVTLNVTGDHVSGEDSATGHGAFQDPVKKRARRRYPAIRPGPPAEISESP